MSGTQETAENRLKRMKMRSWRRGTKEMDLILGRFADTRLAALDTRALDQFDRLLAENDQDLYQWVSGQVAAPPEHAEILSLIAAHARAAGVGGADGGPGADD